MSSTQRNSLTPHMAGAIVLFAIVAAWAFLLRHGTLGGAPLERPLDAGLEYTLDSLPNGVRYYVHARSSGERAELRLVVDAGSLQEDEDQRGLAHAVEHMVFRGTRRFPGGAVERWFDAIGMRRGDDVNATTSTDDTRFRMTVPTTRAGSIDTALAMLASMAHEATFDAGDARRESGVLLEEWRTSRGVEARLADARRASSTRAPATSRGR
jgi:zinc protease